MKLIDTNIILRFLLKDNLELWAQAEAIINSGDDLLILDSVMAEVIYVLKKLYNVPKEKIADCLLQLCNLGHIKTEHADVTLYAIKQYGILSLDFVDILLYAYHVNQGIEVLSFDKKLNNLIKKTI